MADRSLIEWTDTTWNVVTGCSVVSPGCTNCYAMQLAGTRLRDHPSRAGLTTASKAGPVWNGQVRFNAGWLTQPLRWKRPRRIFVAAHGDLFHEGVTDAQLDQIFAVMALAPQHTFQVLTKRPERMRAYLGDPGSPEVALRYRAITAAVEALGGTMPSQFWFMRHIWLGFSAEDQRRFDERWAVMKAVSAFGPRWASLEPLLGPIDFDVRQDWCDLCGGTGILARWPKGKCHVCKGKGRVAIMGPPSRTSYACLDWVVVGGESGRKARPMHPDWVRDLRDQCAAAGVAFLFKQWGEWAPGEDALDTLGRAVRTADWFDGRWDFQRLTAATAEAMHADDEPTLYRAGKKGAGRLLDGVLHDAYPEPRKAA